MNNKLNIRDEEILLIGLCRLDFGVELKVMLQALVEEITDWEYFTSLANSHGVAALVYNNLERMGFLRFIPAETADFLRNALLMSLSRNAKNTQMMGEVLKLLNRESVKTVLLKGMALEQMVYENRGLRQMTDVDVLVERKDCIRARNELMNNGYATLPFKSAIHKLIIQYIGKHLPSLIKNGFSVELHHELFGAGKNVLTKMLFDNSYESELAGEKVFIPQPQIFFLYLVKHLFLHEMNNESQLRLYTDLVVLIGKFREEIINYDLLEYATRAGMCEILAWRLEPLSDLWGISFPEWINDFIDKWYNPASINKFVFFLKSPKDNPLSDKAWLYRNTLKDIPGLHRKLIFILGDLFPTISWMKNRYGCTSGVKALLYYPHRIGKLWYLVKGSTAQRRNGTTAQWHKIRK
jgi:hypothetical protein